MKNGSRYVFGAALAGAAMGVPGILGQAQAGSVTAASFTFETSGLAFSATASSATNHNVTASTFGPLLADAGTGSAYGVHASASTVYSSPTGNGSPHSFSSNNFAVNDYYQFSIPTTNLNDLVFSFDQVSSSTGPKAFTFQYSTDGSSFIPLAGYVIDTASGMANTTVGASSASTSYTTTTNTFASFASGSSNSAFATMFDLSTITALNNDPAAAFRLVNMDSTAAATGTDRVDNVVLTGDNISAAPEPSALVLTSVAAGGLLFRRRGRSLA